MHKLVALNTYIMVWLSILTLSLNVLYAQDIHFTQYHASPLTLNPAMTGIFTGTLRAGGNYRNQWRSVSSPFVTMSVFYDHKIHLGADDFGLGGVLINDRSGPSGLNVNKLFVGGAYHKTISAHTISGGVQFGLVEKSISPDLTFPDQFDYNTGGFNSALPSNEFNLQNKHLYIDLNLGVFWKVKIRKVTPYLGISIFHFNKPNESLLGEPIKLQMRNVVHGGVKVLVKERVVLIPNWLFMRHNEASEVNFGGALQFWLKNQETTVRYLGGGAYYRNNLRGFQNNNGFNGNADAAVIYGNIGFMDFDLGISYDFNVSELNVASNYKGGLEISLIYKKLFDKQPREIRLPCTRF